GAAEVHADRAPAVAVETGVELAAGGEAGHREISVAEWVRGTGDDDAAETVDRHRTRAGTPRPEGDELAAEVAERRVERAVGVEALDGEGGGGAAALRRADRDDVPVGLDRDVGQEIVAGASGVDGAGHVAA